MIRTVVWGTGNMGRAGIRAVVAHPELELVGVVSRSRAGHDAGAIAGVAPLGLAAVAEPDLTGVDAVVYAASGDLRPDDALADLCTALRAGCVVVTPSVYALYDPRGADAATREAVETAAKDGGGALLVSGIDPGWGNDVLPLLLSGLAGSLTQIRCQELFDYSTYDAPEAVRGSVGMGGPMDQVPVMVLPGVPTMIWGGQVRMLARALGVQLDELRETVERRALDADVVNEMGLFEAGTQGGLRFEVQGWSGGEPVIVVEHVTRIDGSVALDWPAPDSGAKGAHRVVLEGSPRLVVTVEATDEADRDPAGVGNSAAGGNATAANRLVNAVPWLRSAGPGVYDALDVPLSPAVGRLGVRA